MVACLVRDVRGVDYRWGLGGGGKGKRGRCGEFKVGVLISWRDEREDEIHKSEGVK